MEKICGQKEVTQVVNEGPSKALWDEVLSRNGMDPSKITAYNVRDDEENEGPSKALWDEVLSRNGMDPSKITAYNVKD